MLVAARQAFNDCPLFKLQKDSMEPNRLNSFCYSAMQGYFQSITDRPIVAEKSRAWMFYYDWLKQFYPNPKVIVCVRDLRAIMSSMEKQRIANPHLVDAAFDPAQMQGLTIEQRVGQWMQGQPVGLSLKVLLNCIHRGVDKEFHFVRYEDLTTHPKEVMDDIYGFIEEEPFEHDFQNVEQLIEENDDMHGIYGDHKVKPVVQPVKKDWNEVIGKELSASVKANNSWFYDKFYA